MGQPIYLFKCALLGLNEKAKLMISLRESGEIKVNRIGSVSNSVELAPAFGF